MAIAHPGARMRFLAKATLRRFKVLVCHGLRHSRWLRLTLFFSFPFRLSLSHSCKAASRLILPLSSPLHPTPSCSSPPNLRKSPTSRLFRVAKPEATYYSVPLSLD
ncbi:hypothetical protein BJ508DRAFT_143310 [Ascobolus immersus RN42]|uniref:Uncharacterized protein n=1 Tax=Ascobolus immersus RN42 TaxID=1160509 RepID=A0A3N4I582_ASCIM|nr:hypothetical protein BJ508DRAFT_143310 [Ascobolus immersus RN42]